MGNVLGKQTFRWFLVFNGVFGPFLLGAAVATFFTGSAFTVDHAAMGETQLSPVVSQWASPWHGLEALANPWNWVLGFAVLFLARMNGTMYMLNNINDDALRPRLRRQILVDAVPFLLFFLAFVGYLLTADGFAVDEQGAVTLVSGKYLLNFLDMPLVLVVFLVGVVLVLSGITIPLRWKESRKGIWFTGTGTVLAVLALFLVAGYNGTSYYPSTADLQSSLTIENSCSSEFTLYTMAIVSLLIPFRPRLHLLLLASHRQERTRQRRTCHGGT